MPKLVVVKFYWVSLKEEGLRTFYSELFFERMRCNVWYCCVLIGFVLLSFGCVWFGLALLHRIRCVRLCLMGVLLNLFSFVWFLLDLLG